MPRNIVKYFASLGESRNESEYGVLKAQTVYIYTSVNTCLKHSQKKKKEKFVYMLGKICV